MFPIVCLWQSGIAPVLRFTHTCCARFALFPEYNTSVRINRSEGGDGDRDADQEMWRSSQSRRVECFSPMLRKVGEENWADTLTFSESIK